MMLMHEPVCTSDGFTFEKVAIEEWLQKRSSSPLTGEPLNPAVLIPNMFARSMVREFVDKHPDVAECIAFRQREEVERADPSVSSTPQQQ